MTIDEVFNADSQALKEGKLTTLALFIEALEMYSFRSWTEATQLFTECLRLSPGDRVIKIYWQRCQQQSS